MSDERHLPSKKPAHDPERDFASYAWRLIGTLRSEAGWLDLTASRLRYSTPAAVVFDVLLAEVTDIIWPWYYFGGGVKLTVSGEQYRFSFVLPNGAEYPTARLAAAVGDLSSLTIVWQKAEDIGAGRAAGMVWRRRLGGAPPAVPAAAPPLTPAP
jgi:hypothetical protein